MNLGKSIELALKENQMTRYELGDKAKVTQAFLSLAVNGKVVPKITTVERLAKAFDMPVSEFIKLGE